MQSMRLRKSILIDTRGPAPLSIKKNRDGCYDNQFVISEVNADIKLFARKKVQVKNLNSTIRTMPLIRLAMR